VLLAAASWLLIASKYGLPVSTTHSAVGGVIAFAVCSKGYGAVKWSKVLMIIASWFISPVMSAAIACVTYLTIIHLVLKHEDSFRRTKVLAPVLVFLMVFIVGLFTIYKGGKGLGLNETSAEVAVGISAGIALVLAGISIPVVPWYANWVMKNQELGTSEKAKEMPAPVNGEMPEPANDKAEKGEAVDVASETIVDLDGKGPVLDIENVAPAKDQAEKEKVPTRQEIIAKEWIANGARDVNTELLFVCPVAIVSGFQALAHGANDCANAVGPFSAVLAASKGELSKKTDIELWVFLMTGCFIGIGLLTFGTRVMKTIGENITPMNPSKAFCSQFAMFLVCLIATRAGIPISTTHAAVGSVIGVGLAEGIRKVDWKMLVGVAGSWVVTLPIVGITTAGIFGMFLPMVWQNVSLLQG